MAAGDFVVRRNASDTTILADTDGGTTDVNWDTAVDNEGSGITYSAGTFTLGETGRFLVMASDQVGTADATANERTTTDLQFVLGGTTLREGACSGYVRRSGGSQEHMPSCMAYLNVTTTAGTADDLTIRHTRRDNSTAGDFARIADRSGVSILKLDDAWNFAHYRSTTAFTPSATDNVRNESQIGTTVEQDGTVFARSGNSVTVTTSNPVLVILTHQVDYTDTLSGRTEMQQSIDFAGSEVAVRGWTQVYGPRATDNANAASMTSATVLYPNGTGQALTGNLIGREDIDEDWFCELQLIELPSGAETATVERTTLAGDANAAGANFAWQSSVNVDTAAFTHTPGNANIDVDNADDYLAIANLGTVSDAGWGSGAQRDVTAIGFRVNTTDQTHAGNSKYNRNNGSAEHAHMSVAALLPGLAANDSVYVRANRLGTTTGARTAVGGFSLIRRSTLFTAATAPTITDVETDEDFDDGDTGVTITGSVFEATQGTGAVELGDAATYGASTLVAQTVTSWADTSIDFTAVLGAHAPGALWLYVTNDTGDTSAGFPVTVHRALAFTLSASANIAAGGTDTTTNRLTGPPGTFVAGRRSDDTSPMASVTFAAGEFTEHEWAVTPTVDAVDTETYEFRVVESDGTALDTYTVTPEWTVGTGAVEFAASISDALQVTATGSKVSVLAASIAEALQSTGTGSRVSALVASIADALQSTATGVTTSDLAASLADALNATAIPQALDFLVASLSDALGATATGSRVAGLSASISDALQATATGTGVAEFSASISDGLQATATGSRASILTASISDALQSTGTGSRVSTLTASISDALAATATGQVTGGPAEFAAVLSDALQSTGTGSKVSAFAASISEALTGTATGSKVSVLSSALSDGLAATADSSLVKAFAAALTDGLGATGTGSRTAALSGSLVDALQATATGQVSGAPAEFAAVISDALSATADGTATAVFGASLTDALASTATGSKVSVLGASISDALASTATGSKVSALAISAADALQATGSGTSVVSFIASLVDALQTIAHASGTAPQYANVPEKVLEVELADQVISFGLADGILSVELASGTLVR